MCCKLQIFFCSSRWTFHLFNTVDEAILPFLTKLKGKRHHSPSSGFEECLSLFLHCVLFPGPSVQPWASSSRVTCLQCMCSSHMWSFNKVSAPSLFIFVHNFLETVYTFSFILNFKLSWSGKITTMGLYSNCFKFLDIFESLTILSYSYINHMSLLWKLQLRKVL